MRAVLGIDAAWTITEPSGVALAIETASGWRLAAVEASYDHFLERARGAAPGEAGREARIPTPGRWSARPIACAGGRSPASRSTCRSGPIRSSGRRRCDKLVSSLYGARKAAAHSPSAARPGPISDALRADFAAFDLEVRIEPPADGLIEVYPHAALIDFMGARERLPYKAGKTRTYWPSCRSKTGGESCGRSGRESSRRWSRRIAGVAAALAVPAPDARGWRLKAFEDRLDAVVCAAVAIAALDGRAVAYGDGEGAIWVPSGGARLGAMLKSGNIFAGVGPGFSGEEATTTLAERPGAGVERIVSTGQASPPGFWYDQDWTEWVIVLAGEAGLMIEGEAAPRTLRPGDYLELPARVRHRVEWTSPTRRPSGSPCTGRAAKPDRADPRSGPSSRASPTANAVRPARHAPKARAANPIMVTKAASEASSATSRRVRRAASRIRTSLVASIAIRSWYVPILFESSRLRKSSPKPVGAPALLVSRGARPATAPTGALSRDADQPDFAGWSSSG